MKEPTKVAPKLLFGKKGTHHGAAHDAVCAEPNLCVTDNGDSTFTVSGLDSSYHTVDITNLATMTVSSADKTVGVDSPVGMSCKVNGLSVGTATITTVVTWNNAKADPTPNVPPTIPTPDPVPWEPCTFDMPATITGDETVGYAVEFGQPVITVAEAKNGDKAKHETKAHAHGSKAHAEEAHPKKK